MANTDALDRLSRALDATGAIVDGVRPDQWGNQTPCADWDVRALLNHLVAGNLLFAGLLQGRRRAEFLYLRTQDNLGADPAGAYHQSSDHLQAAFARPGALEQMMEGPFGPMPGVVAVQLRVTETLIHGWDLAAATNQPRALPDDLAGPSLAWSRANLTDAIRQTGSFGPAQSAPTDAPAIDQLAAWLGRTVPAQ